MIELPRPLLPTGLIGGFLIILSQQVADKWGWSADLLLFAGVLCAAYSAALFLLAIWHEAEDSHIRLMNTADRKYMLAQEAHGMTIDQIRFVEQSAHLGIDYGLDGGRYLRGTDAPIEWVAEFLGKSFNRRLYPVRNYSSGSKEHEYADQVTRAIINAGFAMCAIGNQSAPLAEGITPEIIASRISITLPLRDEMPPDWNPIG